MPRPGTDVVLTEPTPTGAAVLDTGQTFMVNVTQRGPVDTYVRIRSLREFENVCGPRMGNLIAYDPIRTHFGEQGGVIIFSRLSGPNAAAAQITVGPLGVSAASPGEWGNDLDVTLEGPSGLIGQAIEAAAAADKPKRRHPNRPRRAAEGPEGRTDGNGDGNGDGDGDGGTGGDGLEPPPPLVAGARVAVRLGGVLRERSAMFTKAQEAVQWSQGSTYVRITADDPDADLLPGGVVPASGGGALGGGVDDNTVTPDVLRTALDRFVYALGPGQVVYPGCTDLNLQQVILDHVWENKRVALLDVDDEDDVQIASHLVSLYTHPGARMAAALAPRLRYPGIALSTTVLVPYSSVQTGIISRQDRATGNPNEPAAGENGISLRARGLAREFTDEHREELNEMGLTLARDNGLGQVRTYGSRTAAGPNEPNWRWFGSSRVVMGIAHECNAVAEQFVHRQIDAQRRLFTELETALTSVVSRYWSLGALYGESPEDAFQIDTSDAVNTEETILAGEIHALVRIATSPPGEWVLIEISKPLSL